MTRSKDGLDVVSGVSVLVAAAGTMKTLNFVQRFEQSASDAAVPATLRQCAVTRETARSITWRTNSWKTRYDISLSSIIDYLNKVGFK